MSIEEEELGKDWIRLRVLEALLAQANPSWSIADVLSMCTILAAWVETGEVPQ